MTSSRTKF